MFKLYKGFFVEQERDSFLFKLIFLRDFMYSSRAGYSQKFILLYFYLS